ncbi:unnamed protein product [Triticum turgidum subsp. durum]|uniref:Uncharacterized protein n=1 Tax=Triticum turgidum subsp. durum TaxID=4567 RepID=A0A9R0YB76_TRITD|nr:unnamed protein product [Triticum turgidum subsp. durum]
MQRWVAEPHHQPQEAPLLPHHGPSAAAPDPTSGEKEEDESTAEDNYDGVLRLPTPKLRFNTSRQIGGYVTNFDFLPLYGGTGTGEGEAKFLCVDGNGMASLYDIEAATVEMMPRLNKKPDPWWNPVSLCVTHTTAAAEDDPSRPDVAHDPDRPDALYVMDRKGHSFEVFVYGDPNPPSPSKFMDEWYRDRVHRNSCVWHWRELPSPPIVLDEANNYHRRGRDPVSVESYALVHGHDSEEDASSSNTTIYVSFEPTASTRERPEPNPAAGTYCFDTRTGEWTKAGDWKLPFWSRALHVPELGNNLLFGFENIGFHIHPHFTVVDISGAMRMDGPAPALRHAWIEIDPPSGWHETNRSMVYLGDGKFCIHRSFNIMEMDGWGSGTECVDTVVLLTGVEVVREGSRLRMVKHKSKRLDTLIHSIL